MPVHYDYWGQPIGGAENKPCVDCGNPIYFGNYCHYCIADGKHLTDEERKQKKE